MFCFFVRHNQKDLYYPIISFKALTIQTIRRWLESEATASVVIRKAEEEEELDLRRPRRLELPVSYNINQ